MRLIAWLLSLLFLLLPAALVALVFMAIEDHPAVSGTVDLNPERLARGQKILDDNDPRKLKAGEIRTVQLGEEDLDLAANYLAHRAARGHARVALRPRAVDLAVAVPLPLPGPLRGMYVNAEGSLLPNAEGLPEFERLSVGRLQVPAALADWLARRALAYANGEEAVDVLADAVKDVKIAGGKLAVTYEWQADLMARLSSAAVPAADLERLRVYQQKMIEVGTQAPKKVSLADLLPPLFRLAGERSAGAGADPIAENRAAIAVLMFYITQRGLDKVLPGAEPWPKPTQRTVKLNGRDDFPKHFIISAALAAAADSPLSDAIGLYKEVKDSRGGSGFSFNDLAADRAGTRLGEMASASPEAALLLQSKLAQGLREPDFMPSTDGLPEFMPEAEFKQRFGGIGEPKYNLMMMEIEKRVAALPLYKRGGMAGAEL
jgi:hypothetical protein